MQTVLTVFLTISLLLFTPKSELLSKLLSSKPMTQIGLISYSLYLWHWPVIVFRKWTLSPSLNNLVFQVVFMTVLAYLSYYFIESKFRYKLWTKKPITTIALGFSICVLAFAFVRVLNTQFRFNTYLGTVENLKKPKCNTANSEILLVGDSHATAIESLIYSISSGKCFKASDKIVTFHNSIKQSREQKQRNFYEISSVEKIKSEIDKSSSKVVVISQYWQAYFSSNKIAYDSSDWLVGALFMMIEILMTIKKHLSLL